ncbi:MAG: hypothetical protein Kow0025_01290 [Thermodesulfovibrionales bacterium]
MKGVKGELGSLPFTDLTQWIEVNRKSGVLFLESVPSGEPGQSSRSRRCFCFGEGKLLLAASDSEGGRFGDFLARHWGVDASKVRSAVREAMREGRSFIALLTERGLISAEAASEAVQRTAEESIMDVLSWEGGRFEFLEGTPRVMAGSPVRLNTGFVVFESVRKRDEKSRGR